MCRLKPGLYLAAVLVAVVRSVLERSLSHLQPGAEVGQLRLESITFTKTCGSSMHTTDTRIFVLKLDKVLHCDAKFGMFKD